MKEQQKGLGRIFKRKDSKTGKEYGPYWIAYYHRGKEIRESSHSSNRTTAAQLLKKRLGEMGCGKFVGPTVERVTVEELLDNLIKDYEVNRRASLPTLRSHIKPLRAEFGYSRAMDITTARVKRIQKAWQEANVTNSTINRRIEMLRRAFNLGRQAGKIPTIPHFPRLVENSPLGKYMSPDVFEAIHRHLPYPIDDLYELAYWLGIRKGQLVGTLLSNVNTDRWALVYEPHQVKNRQPHVIPLEGRPLEIVRRLWSNRRLDCPYLFHKDGKGIGDFKKAWATACRKAGFPVGRKNGGYVFHNTRHTAVTNMVNGGMPESLAMGVSGHQTRSVFDRYSIRCEDATRAAFRKVTEYVNDLQSEAKVIPLKTVTDRDQK